MNNQTRKILFDYEVRISTENKLRKTLNKSDFLQHREDFLLSIGKDAAKFIHKLIISLKPQHILELGTSYGYSTIWLADAARTYGGKVITVDSQIIKSKYAKESIYKAGLSEFVEFKVSDARDYIKETELKFNFILMDLWKEYYRECLDALIPKLAADSYIVSDNILEPVHYRLLMKEYQQYINSLDVFESKLVKVGNGLEVSIYKPM